MTEIFNLRTLCRCCHSDGSFKSLQLSYAYDNHIEVYSTMLKETLDVMINPPPFEASYAICDCCIQKLRDASVFKQQVLECELKFEEYCKNELALTIKEEADYESSNDGDLTREENTYAYNHDEGEKDEKGVDKKIYDDLDKKNHAEIKHEIQGTDGDFGNEEKKCAYIDVEVPAVSQKTLKHTHGGDSLQARPVRRQTRRVVPAVVAQAVAHQQIPNDVKPDVAGAQNSDKILKQNDVKAAVKRKQKVYPELELHVKIEDDVTYVCKVCDAKYKVVTQLRKHIRSLHQIYRCPHCSLKVLGRIKYTKHLKTHPNESFTCHACGKSFTNKNSFDYHLNAHTRTDKFQCDMCQKIFNKKSSLLKHILWHLGANKKFMCDVCGRGFNDTTNLNVHVQTVHEKLRPFACPLCPKTFSAKKHLKEHSNYHTGETPYECELCDASFGTSGRLRHHKFRHHPESNCKYTDSYKCKVCGLEVAQRGAFHAHVRRHAGNKLYKCHLCPKDFTCRYSLKRHVFAHSGLKPHECDLCDARFTQASQLWRHKKRLHDPARPRRTPQLTFCQLCNRSFKNINKHLVSHQSRPHKCELCSKSYPEAKSLSRHIQQIHQGLKPHPCTLCEKKYNRWETLHNHMRKKHKLELKKEKKEA